jgi:hypothetical protein
MKVGVSIYLEYGGGVYVVLLLTLAVLLTHLSLPFTLDL